MHVPGQRMNKLKPQDKYWKWIYKRNGKEKINLKLSCLVTQKNDGRYCNPGKHDEKSRNQSDFNEIPFLHCTPKAHCFVGNDIRDPKTWTGIWSQRIKCNQPDENEFLSAAKVARRKRIRTSDFLTEAEYTITSLIRHRKNAIQSLIKYTANLEQGKLFEIRWT